MPAQRHRRRQRSETPINPPPAEEGPVGEDHDLDTERSPLPTDARQLTRMVAMNWNPRSLLNCAIKLRRAMADGSEQAVRDAASKTEKLYFSLYDELDHLQPDLFDLIAERDGHFTRNVRQKLSDGRNGAKAEDNHKGKHVLPHLRDWQPSLIDEPKSSRGLNHPEIAKALSPITVNWDDEEQRRQFLECSNPPMVAKHWGRYLYANGKGDPSHPSDGLFQGELLVGIANALLKSPSSVVPSRRIRPNTVRRGRKGIGAKYKLTKVTPAFIAYVAVITRFALSSDNTFSDDGGTFDYIVYYSQLREYLEAPKYQRRAKVLMSWWNKTLFPDVIQGDDADAGVDDITGGMLSLLAAEVENDEDAEMGGA